jgi:hypothetical protein
MDNSDGLVDGEVYQAHEMADVSITVWTEVRRAEKRKCHWTGAASRPREGR